MLSAIRCGSAAVLGPLRAGTCPNRTARLYSQPAREFDQASKFSLSGFPRAHSAGEIPKRVGGLTMTPPFLLEAPAGEQATGGLATRHGDPRWETAPGGARITRGAGAGRALVAVVGLGHAGLPSAITLRSA